jgi:hypothetical protein
MDMIEFKDVLIAMHKNSMPVGIEDFIVCYPIATAIYTYTGKGELVSSVIK